MLTSLNRLRELQVQCISIIAKTKNYTINQKQVHLITKRLQKSSGNKIEENLLLSFSISYDLVANDTLILNKVGQGSGI